MALYVFATSDQNQNIRVFLTSEKSTIAASSTSEKSTTATLKSPFQVTSTFDNMKSSTTSLTTQATSVELSPKSDNSTIKPNDNFIKGIYIIRFVLIQH